MHNVDGYKLKSTFWFIKNAIFFSLNYFYSTKRKHYFLIFFAKFNIIYYEQLSLQKIFYFDPKYVSFNSLFLNDNIRSNVLQ